MKNYYTLLTPGPVSFPSCVQKTLSEPSLHHRSKAFQDLFQNIQKPLQSVFQTKEFVITLNGSGSAAMEAGVTNTLSPEDEVLCVSIGKFGERWEEINKAYKIKVHSLKYPAGHFTPPEEIENYLKKHSQIKAVFIQACETSTGTNQPVKEIAKVLNKHSDILFIVDGVTGLGTMNLPMNELGIDILVAGSQKTFMIPTGLSFVALSKKAWSAYNKSSCPRYYFDLKKELETQKKGQTVFSSNVTLIRALNASLNLYEEKQLSSIIARCKNLAKTTHVFFQSLSLPLFSKNPSNALTAIKMPKEISTVKIKKALEEDYGIVIATGQGVLKNELLRIGHIGPIKNQDILKALYAIGLEINKELPEFYTKEKINKALSNAKDELQQHPEIF